MALVSPGIQISINDQSQYVNSNVGSVPLVVLATAQDKMYNGSAAVGTSKANAGKLLSFTSQRDLITAMGTPTFQLSSASTPVNGSELNEYGLLTAYSALGMSNQLFAIRADIDLNQLVGTSIRPVGSVADGALWLDLANTEFGIFEEDASTRSFMPVAPLLITDLFQVTDVTVGSGTVPYPIRTVGKQGDYALTFVNADGTAARSIRLFHKVGSLTTDPSLTNTWVLVGSTTWQNCVPVLQGTTVTPSNLTSGMTFFVAVTGAPSGNGSHTVTTTGATLDTLVTNINTALTGTGITAKNIGGFLTVFASGTAQFTLSDGTGTPLAKCGVTLQTNGWASPILYYGSYAQSPTSGWFSTDAAPRPTGSIWWKTSSIGGGFNPVLKQYSAGSDSWKAIDAPLYATYLTAIYGIDPTGGGLNIKDGQIVANSGFTGNQLIFAQQQAATQTDGTSTSGGTFSASNIFVLQASAPGSLLFNSKTITTTGNTAASFVNDILNANVPYVSASYNSITGQITITHTTGGQINLIPDYTTPSVLSNAGFTAGSSPSVYVLTDGSGTVGISNFRAITTTILYSATTPYAAPADGTLWYYSNPAEVDIMINKGGSDGWVGYLNGGTDTRGYDLSMTDPNGVIVSASEPVTQSDGTSYLVPGDLWLDSSDLVNFPKLSRVKTVSNGRPTWEMINNSDQVSSNGILFADARWGNTSDINPITEAIPTTQSLLVSNFKDADCPDSHLYPRGALLFNTRRSGYNVKKFVSGYINSISFPHYVGDPQNAWISVSGLKQDGSMYAGPGAQRNIIVRAMESAVNSNTDVLDVNYRINLIVAPNYPELIPSLVTLNDNRGSTGFIIGDTPMTLSPTTTALTNWSNNQGEYAGLGLATASPYLAVYYPAGLTTDLSGNTVAVPPSHAVLRTYLYNDQVSHPWFAPAGVQRGLISNLSDLGYINAQTGEFVHNSINNGLRDALYTLNINPLTQLPGTGLVVWGQETRSGSNTARNRVNVVRLENYLRTIFASIANAYLFEPNDTITRKSIASQIESALHNLLSLRGLYDFLVICDTSNNTSNTIANNQLYVDVAIEPMRDVEFIYIPIAIYNPGTIASLGVAST